MKTQPAFLESFAPLLFVIATVLPMAPVAAGVPPILFSTPPSYPVGSGPFQIIAADFNGDGNPDLATANFNDNTLSILTGQGNGAFGAAIHYPVGAHPDALATGDLNGDSQLDVVTANGNGWNQPGTASVLLGRGDGALSTATNVTVGRGPRGIVLSDFDSDGKLDMATAISGGWFETNQVNVLRGRGDGSFESPAWYAVGTAPAWITAGDFNGDQKPDLVTVNAGPGASGTTASVLLNRGDGTFATASTQAVGTYPGFVVAADFNQDGKSDLAIANRANLSVSILLGRGDGTFDPATNLAVPGGVSQLAVSDLDRDGRLDLAVLGGNYDSGAVSVLLGNGSGGFAAPEVCTIGAALQAIAAGDFNGDNFPDLTVAGAYDSAVLLMAGRGNGTFRNVTDTYSVSGAIRHIIAADFNHDGQHDLATANPGNNVANVILQQSNGVFLSAAAYPVGEQPQTIKTADFNNDGRLDLVTANFDGTLSLLRGRASVPGEFTTNWNISGYDGTLRIGSNHNDVAVGDFDADGKMDLITPNYYGASLSIAVGRGDGTFSTGPYLTVNSGPVCLRVDDFDGDSKADVAVGYDGGTAISVLRGLGNGTFQPRQEVATWEIPWFITSADINFDGKPDLVAAHGDWRRISVMLNLTASNGPIAFAPPFTHDVANDPVCVAVGDFNGDNLPDIASANFASVSVLLGLGDGTFMTATNYFVGGSWAAVTDFNLDGMPDLALDLGSKVGVFWNNTLPQLQISRAVGGVRVAYPAWKPYTLERSTLAKPGVWSVVSDTPTRFGSQFVVTNAVQASGQVYRLKRPVVP